MEEDWLTLYRRHIPKVCLMDRRHAIAKVDLLEARKRCLQTLEDGNETPAAREMASIALEKIEKVLHQCDVVGVALKSLREAMEARIAA